MSYNYTTRNNVHATRLLASGNLRSTNPRRPHLRRLVLLGSLLLGGCSDSPSGVTAAPRGADALPTTAIGRDSLSPALAVVIRGLENEASTRGADSRARAVMRLDGVEREVVGPLAIRDALVSSMQRSRHADAARDGKFSTFSVPLDDKKLYITGVASFVLASPAKFQFTSVTYINQTTNAQYTFNSDRAVYAISSGASTQIWSESGTQVRSDINGNSAVAWPDFNLSGGCQFSASNTTGHSVAWPWGFVVSGVSIERASARSGGSNAISRSCGPSTPPPPSESLCEENISGCPTGGSGGTGRTTGGAVAQEIGRSGGYKTVCYVTDWYENGVYVETTVDRCWTEPIY